MATDKQMILNDFGKTLISEVRDTTIRNYIKMFDGTMNGLTARQVHEKLDRFNDEQMATVKWLLSKIVDTSLHNILFMLEQNKNELELLYKGLNINEISDGLCGELYSEDGWIEKYSKEDVV